MKAEKTHTNMDSCILSIMADQITNTTPPMPDGYTADNTQRHISVLRDGIGPYAIQITHTYDMVHWDAYLSLDCVGLRSAGSGCRWMDNLKCIGYTNSPSSQATKIVYDALALAITQDRNIDRQIEDEYIQTQKDILWERYLAEQLYCHGDGGRIEKITLTD